MLWSLALSSVTISAISVYSTLQHTTSKLKYEGTVTLGQTKDLTTPEPSLQQQQEVLFFSETHVLNWRGENQQKSGKNGHQSIRIQSIH